MAAGTLVQGALFTVMVVRAGMLRDPDFAHELAAQVERSPRFFRNAPVVLDLKGADGFTEAADFAEARDLLREHTLALVGVQNAEPAQLAAAAAAGLASFAPSATQPIRRARRGRRRRRTTRRRRAADAGRRRPRRRRAPRPRIVTEPVRSGTQIYARGGDLSSPRGQPRRRADGRRQHPCLWPRCAAGRSPAPAATPAARIFCTRLEAELVSIAGRYLVSEQLPAEQQGVAGADRAGR